MRCNICHNSTDNKVYTIKERQLNEGESFHYLRCSKCGTLQLMDDVADIGAYYPKSYPAFRTRESIHTSIIEKVQKKILLSLLLNLEIPQKNRDMILDTKNEHLNPLVGTHLKRTSSLLDVGCGAGNWIRNLREEGFTNLTGVDLFTNEPKDMEGWKFLTGEVFNDQLKTYDCITLHHSFEHMTEPLRVLERIKALLNTNGLCIIRIPVMESLAWDMYGVDWYQIDAPRHFYLYTVRAMRYLCKKVGMKVKKVIYDSEPTQFYISEMYQETEFDLMTILKRLDKKRETNVTLAKKANCDRKGDQAIFYINNG